MQKKLLMLSLLASSTLMADEIGLFKEAHVSGEIRAGAVEVKDEAGKKNRTYALGGSLGLESNELAGFSVGAKFFTTNPIFGKREEGLFLSSTNEGYSMVGEAYVKYKMGKTTITAGRQELNTPFADSDDIAMMPNRFEGYTLVNQDAPDTTIVLTRLNRWSGVDAPVAEKFQTMEGGKVTAGGLIYTGTPDTTIEGWYYKSDDLDIKYTQAVYEKGSVTMGVQYADQSDGNTAYGVTFSGTMDGVTLRSSYNSVEGVVTNGFGGGPFFTSSEDHTIADVKDQKAWRYGLEYGADALILGVSQTKFEIGADETDYLVSYEANKDISVDFIYCDIGNNGKVMRLFANYQF